MTIKPESGERINLPYRPKKLIVNEEIEQKMLEMVNSERAKIGIKPLKMDMQIVKFLSAGENIALAPTLETAHQSLMNSPGHRRNILDPDFGRVGIGIVDGGIYGKMFTQNFAN